MIKTNVLFVMEKLHAEDAISFLGSLNYKFFFADSGKNAQAILLTAKIDFCFVDFKVKNYNFIEICRFIKLKFPSIVIVMIVDPSQLFEDYNLYPRDLFKLGVTDIIQDKNNFELYKNTLEGHASFKHVLTFIPNESGVTKDEIEVIKLDNEFSVIPLDQFVASRTILFDVYIKIGSNKYLKILHGGDSFDKTILEKYRAKGVKYLYFSNSDRSKYSKFCNALLNKLLEKKNTFLEIKVNLARAMVEKHVEEFYFKDIKKPILNQSKEVITSIFKMLENEKNLGKYLRNLKEISLTSYSHSFLVTLFSSSIVQNLSWDSIATRETISMGALFHDIGKIRLAENILNKDVLEMSDEELAEYKKHPSLGAELIVNEKIINSSMCQIVLYHHETRDGMGFPHNLKNHKIPISAEIVGMANYFVDYMTSNQLSPIEALTIIVTQKLFDHIYSPELIKALANILIR